ncbi:hypothetical protein KQX54_018388 [Cotesia glomerata]|uniref:Uncharacterized protein n=1 Tax=Cotesia glomerata TaxID=32391 RepID=A0AAV7IGG6_COTGL|nr:hypothetical protein KQX54_018388 [Cotesia glomerata]
MYMGSCTCSACYGAESGGHNRADRVIIRGEKHFTTYGAGKKATRAYGHGHTQGTPTIPATSLPLSSIRGSANAADQRWNFGRGFLSSQRVCERGRVRVLNARKRNGDDDSSVSVFRVNDAQMTYELSFWHVVFKTHTQPRIQSPCLCSYNSSV